MNILLVAPRFPYPPNRGGEITIFNFLKYLSETDRVTLVCYFDHESELQYLPELRKYAEKVITVKRRRKWSPIVVVRWLFLGECYMIARHTCRGMRNVIQQQISDGTFDLIQVESFLLMKNLPVSTKLPIVLDMHNVFAQIVLRMAESFYNPMVRAVSKLEWRRTQAQEIEAWKRATVNVSVSEADRALLYRVGGASIPCEVVCPGAESRNSVDRSNVIENRIIFVGSLHYHPNIDALNYFVREILPRIRELYAGVEVLVVGRDPKADLEMLLTQHGVTLEKNVPDVSPFLASAAVEFVPLRVGGGVRMKILEAMAAGKAVVSTTVGCEGLPVVDGVHLLIKDSPIEFARAVVGLLEDSERRKQLEINARILGHSAMSWKHSLASLRAIHARVCQRA